MDVGKMGMRGLLPLIVLLGFGTGTLTAQQRGGGRWAVSSRPPDINLTIAYGADGFLSATGGVSNSAAALDNLDLILHLNLKALPGLRGTSIRVHVQSNRGGLASPEVGALQGISNLEAQEEWRLYEAWIEHQFRTPRLSLLAGVYDINSEFDAIPSAADFLNSSFGFGPEFGMSGLAGPSTFPSTGLAARVMVQPSPTLYGLFGVSDAIPGDTGEGQFSLDSHEGALFSLEVGYALRLSSLPSVELASGRLGQQGPGASGPQRRRVGRGRPIEDVSTKVAIGGWAYSRKFQPWAPDAPTGRSWGMYLLGERILRQDADGSGRLSAFARVGYAADEINRLDLSLKGGLVYGGPIPGRPDDHLGLGVSNARNGTPYMRGQRSSGVPMERSETVLELMYRAAITPYLTIQPDLQWIANPGMSPHLSNALVLGLRGHILLDFPGVGQGTDSP